MGKDYEIGYGKPPKHTQFKKDQSGNPAGSKRGTRGLKTDLMAELNAQQTISINKQPVTGRRQQLAIRVLASRAALGELKALQLLIPMIIQVLGVEDRGAAKEQLSAADQALLDEIFGEASEQAKASDPDDAGEEQPGPAGDGS